MRVEAWSKDTTAVTLPGQKEKYWGYVPGNINVGDRYGDVVDVCYCMDCGQMSGDWPLPDLIAKLDDSRRGSYLQEADEPSERTHRERDDSGQTSDAGDASADDDAEEDATAAPKNEAQ